VTARGAEPLARAGVRLLALAALLVLCLVRWCDLLRDEPNGGAVAFALAATAVSGGLVLAARLPDVRAKAAAAALGTVALLAGAVTTAGVPPALLDPRHWDVLVAGFGDGLSALPSITVPYRGANDWVRVAIAAGGTLLAAVVALTAAWPRAGGRSGPRGWALLALGVLFAVPAVELTAQRPWVVGVLFAIPLCLFVLAEQLPVRLASAGGSVVLACVLAAMALAPALDAADPLVDVEQIAAALEPDRPDRFDFSHVYGPLDWPRDGRELLRVRARRPSYWKAEDLELFDGLRWTTQAGANRHVPIAVGLREHPGWRQEVRVTLKGLRTRQFVSPGETLSISRAPRQPVNARAGGFSVEAGGDDLGRDDAYLAEAYVPRPSAVALRASVTAYPGYLGDELAMLTPPDGTMGRTMIRFMPFGSGMSPVAIGAGVASERAVEVLDRAGYGDVYRLARRLADGAPTPYDFARRVERHLNGPDFVYDENAAERRLPLPAFLLRDKAGYCQHFSGAMALLLRMGGVAARVSGGFTPGQFDKKRREYVVRDLDAHSWVEVWFDGIGWVTFDPTPTEAPARSQAGGAALGDPGVVPGGPQPAGAVGGGADLGPGAEGTPFADTGGDQSPWPVIGGAAAVALLGWGGWWLVSRHHARRSRGGDRLPPELAELERALRRTGRRLPPGTTLLQLEGRYAHNPEARAYVRALTARRYGGGGAGPTGVQRRALRRELAGGFGPVGRVRALWALPPRARLH
jgi:hypothetical protein